MSPGAIKINAISSVPTMMLKMALPSVRRSFTELMGASDVRNTR